MKNLQQELFDAILEAAPSAIEGANGKRSGRTINLSTAQLELAPIRETPPDPWSWQPPSFKVFAQSAAILRAPRDRYDSKVEVIPYGTAMRSKRAFSSGLKPRSWCLPCHLDRRR